MQDNHGSTPQSQYANHAQTTGDPLASPARDPAPARESIAGASNSGETPPGQNSHYLDEYLETHYQFTKFRQKPLIRIAAWIDSHLPENGWVNRFLHNLTASLSILKNQGWKALYHRLAYKNRISARAKVDWSGTGMDPLRTSGYYELNPALADAILRYATEHPAQKPDILILSFIDWEFRYQRPQQLAAQLAQQGHRVFYIQANFSLGKTVLVNQIQERVFLVRLTKGDSTISLSSTLVKGSADYLQSHVDGLASAFNIQFAIIKVDLPAWRQLAIQLQTDFNWKLIYDCMDEHAGFSHGSPLAEEDERMLAHQSDLILASSNVLYKKMAAGNRNLHLLQNAGDYRLFHTAAHSINPELLRGYPHPVIGYYGAIADWFDTQLVRELALKHADWSFVLIGSTDLADLKPLYGVNNVHLLGEKPYEQLPGYLSQFDVCIVPFKKSSLTQSTNPVKLYEFLAAGKPIVATPLQEISTFSRYVRLAGTIEEWEQAIRECLEQEISDDLLNQRFEFARLNTWEARAKDLEVILTGLFPRISIILVTYNCLEYTRMCLESIVRNTDYPNYEVIVVDNGSSDGTVEFLEEYRRSQQNIALICNDRNLGFAAANNLGAKSATGDYLVLLNNDTLVTPGWLHRLLAHLTKEPRVGMVGPVTNSIGNEARVDAGYADLKDLNYFAATRADAYHGSTFEIQVLALYCAMISRELYSRLDGLDERYQAGMFEDDDLAQKITHAGRTLLCAEDVFIHHFHGVSFQQLPEQEFHRLFEENRLKYEHKWGVSWKPHQQRSRS